MSTPINPTGSDRFDPTAAQCVSPRIGFDRCDEARSTRSRPGTLGWW
jgi:hypothetical protein